MNHPTEDQLLLFAYDELAAAEAGEVESHLASCPACRAQVERLTLGRVAVDLAAPLYRARVLKWAAAGLAAAAVLAAVLLTARRGDAQATTWPAELRWSVTAGYVVGGPAVVAIDSQLTRLEQETRYVRP
jgi:anti-sigma factor RsiW